MCAWLLWNDFSAHVSTWPPWFVQALWFLLLPLLIPIGGLARVIVPSAGDAVLFPIAVLAYYALVLGATLLHRRRWPTQGVAFVFLAYWLGSMVVLSGSVLLWLWIAVG